MPQPLLLQNESANVPNYILKRESLFHCCNIIPVANSMFSV